MTLRIGRNNSDNDNAPDAPPPPANPDTAPAGGGTPPRRGIKPLFLGLGVVVLLALAGGAYMALGTNQEEIIEEAPPMPPRRNPVAPGAPPAQAGAPPAPAGAAKPAVAPRVPAVPAIAPQLKAQLKQLWDQGAAAKHRNDYKGARVAWQKILQLRPGHPGIQDAIDQLPPR